MSDCRYTPPARPSTPTSLHFGACAASLAGSAAGSKIGAGHVPVDSRSPEYLAAMRGLLGPEAGPPSDDEKARIRMEEEHKKRSRLESSDRDGVTDSTQIMGVRSATFEGRGEGRRRALQGAEGESVDELIPPGLICTRDHAAREVNGHGMRKEVSHDVQPEEEGEGVATVVDVPSRERQSSREAIGGRADVVKLWETPGEARERLTFRLAIAARAMDVANAATAWTSAMASKTGLMRPENWATLAEGTARFAGVGALHGRALSWKGVKASGRPGVTW